MKNHILIIFSLAALIISCKSNKPTEPETGNPIITTPEVKILSESVKSSLIPPSYSQDTLIFVGSVSGFAKNDIIVSDVNEGILRKVKDIKIIGSKTYVMTEQASLVDAFETASFSDSFNITEASIQNIKYNLTGIRLEKTANPSELRFRFDNAVIWDKDNNPSTKNDQVTASGGITIQLKPRLSCKIKNKQVKTLELSIEPTGIIELDFDVPIELPPIEPKPILLFTIRTHPVVFFVGPVPVVITNDIPISLGLKGEVKANINTGIKNVTSFLVGAKLEEGKWSTFNKFKNEFTYTPPTITAECNLRIFLEPKLEMKLYGVVGPTINFEGYVEGAATLSHDVISGQTDLNATIYGGLDAGVGVTMKIFDWHIASYYSPDIIQVKLKLYEWNKIFNRRPAKPSNPSPPNNSINIPLNTTISWDCSDPDSDPITYDIYFGTSSNPPLIRSGNTGTSYNPTGLMYNTKYYWKIIAKDIKGSTNSGDLWNFTTVSLVNNPPNAPTNPSPADGATGQSTSPTLSWNASSGATSYALQVSTNSSFSSYVFNQSGLTSTSRQLSGLINSTTYYWRVSATNSYGTSNFSNIWSFTTIEPGIIYLINDNFESYAVGAFPPSGGWYERYNGSGHNIIDNTRFHSGTKSFRLQGKPGWSAVIENHNAGGRASALIMGYEIYLYTEAGDIATGFHDYAPLWGAYWGSVTFGTDGKIYAGGNNIMSYTFRQWYKVKVEVTNVSPYNYKVWINDTYKGEYTQPSSPNHSINESYFIIASAHSGNYGWFDDAKVWYR